MQIEVKLYSAQPLLSTRYAREKNPNWFSSAAHATLSKESTESIVSEVPITLKTQF